MTSFRTVSAGGLEIFYREAGRPGAPKVLLLGGSAAASYQFRCLLPALADRFHLLAVDYPGFGNSESPDPAGWDYTFDSLTEIVDEALLAIGFTGPMGLYLQGHGGPIGNRLISLHPDWLQWQIIQNANSYDEGFTPIWEHVRNGFWTTRDTAPVEALLAPQTLKSVHLTGHPDPARISPDSWNLELRHLTRPWAREVQLDLLYDYRTNAARYAAWQRRFRRDQPKTLVLWGQGDYFFTPAGGEAYLRDLPDARLIRLDSGHYALEDRLQEIVAEIKSFYHDVIR
ncbi:alpha/beta fold hydrolase [Kribbella sp. NPDC051770]|uniref:alpha/beta fold hydrolase n=1 Tax=Kribbella sp. NPDC051770 TaxID=3155413 RepID=UPI00344AD904